MFFFLVLLLLMVVVEKVLRDRLMMGPGAAVAALSGDDKISARWKQVCGAVGLEPTLTIVVSSRNCCKQSLRVWHLRGRSANR
jgi:hypothetical protein